LRTATLKTYAYPVIGDLPVSAVDVALVLRILEPIWKDKRETADRVTEAAPAATPAANSAAMPKGLPAQF
jgi:hypothetical protein